MKPRMKIRKINNKDQMFFVKRLSFLIKAGIPMRESLLMIREQTMKGAYASILDTVIDNVSNGQNLSTSLARFKNAFGAVFFGENPPLDIRYRGEKTENFT